MDTKQGFEAMMKKRWPLWKTNFSPSLITMLERAFLDAVEHARQYWHERDISKLTRFLVKYCIKETSAPITPDNAVDVAILIIQKYLLRNGTEDNVKVFYADTPEKLKDY